MSRRNVSAAGCALLFSLAFLSADAQAARGVEDKLTGKVALGKEALPGKKGEKAYGQALARRARGRAVFWEDPKSKSWKIHYAAVVKRPVLDATITVFDISKGKKLVATRDKMLYKQSRIVSGSIALSRDQVFSPNARLLMVVETGGRVVVVRPGVVRSRGHGARRRRGERRRAQVEATPPLTRQRPSEARKARFLVALSSGVPMPGSTSCSTTIQPL
jgi:hypothetical protein